MKRILAFFIPHGIARIYLQRRKRKQSLEQVQQRVAAKLHYLSIAPEERSPQQVGYDEIYEKALELGVDPDHLRAGTMPRSSLKFVQENLITGIGLHIGNYAGVSLTTLAIDSKTLIVSIDPNVTHRGLFHPQDIVCELLNWAGVESNVLLICGYSESWNPSNNGYVHDGHDPAAVASRETAPTGVLRNLAKLGARFSWALVDGNHDASYLRHELNEIRSLLVPDGLVFLDDCTEWWPEILEVFSNPGSGWKIQSTDGRVGIIKKEL